MVEIVYWSGTGNTEAMAQEIEAAAKAAGAEVESVLFDDTDVDTVASKDVILLGCPAMGAEELEETVVEPFVADLLPKLSGKKVGLFGSYGWGTGEWMDAWEQRVKDAVLRLSVQLLLMKHRIIQKNAKHWAKLLHKHNK